jgi:hypothetical protein
MSSSHRLLFLSPPATAAEREHVHSIMQFHVPTTDGRQFTISLLGQAHTVNCICVSIPDSDGNLSEEDLRRIFKINSRMLATLRLSYDPNANVVPMDDSFINAVYVSDEEYPTKLPIDIYMNINQDFRINVENIERVFRQGGQIPGLFEILVEVVSTSLPTHYRFLALYKVLEIASEGAKGFSPTVKQIIDNRNSDFKELHVSNRNFIKFVHEYRNKCAHIYSGGDLTLGIVGLVSAEAENVRKVMPLMLETMFEVIRTCYPSLGVTFRQRRPDHSSDLRFRPRRVVNPRRHSRWRRRDQFALAP